MGQPRKATHVLELTGRMRTNPDRKRPQEPMPPLALSVIPPKWMVDSAERRAYREIVRDCHRDVLSTADGIWVQIVASLLADWRKDRKSMDGRSFTRLMAGLSALGMEPSARSKVGKIPREAENPFKEFAAPEPQDKAA